MKKENLDVDPQSMDNRRLSAIARNPKHPMHTHAKSELDRRRMKVAESKVNEVSFKTLSNYMRKSAADAGKPRQSARTQDKRIGGQKMADDKLRKMDGKGSAAKVAATPSTTTRMRSKGWIRGMSRVENVNEAATPAMKKAADELNSYAKKSGGIDKADFMKAAKMLSSGKAGMALIKFVDGQDTDVYEKIIRVMAKHMGKQTVEKMFKVNIREEVKELDEDLTHQTVKPPSHTKKYSGKDHFDTNSIFAAGNESHTVTSSQADAHDKTAAHHNEVADAHKKAGEKASSPTLQRLHHQASVQHKKAATAHFNASHSSSGEDKDGSIQKSAKDMHMSYHITMHANKMSQEVRNKGTKAKRMNIESTVWPVYTRIMEISNKTLTRYAMSADNDVQKRRSNRPAGKGDESDPKIGKRLDKINLAHKKGAFKEESVNELSKDTMQSYWDKTKGDDAFSGTRKANNRLKGAINVTTKLDRIKKMINKNKK